MNFFLLNPRLFRLCNRFSAGISVALCIARSTNAWGGDGHIHANAFWVLVWIIVLVVVVFVGYLQQNRMVRRKTAELKQELFERQMAEKELQAIERSLRQSLAEKESLLKEIHHRVKNNLQIVSSLLYLQEEYMTDAKGIEILRESQNRVKSMALIHEQLYGTADLARIDFGRYIQGLAANLFDAYCIDPNRIRLNVRADEIGLGIDKAVPCGLIINELVSNALKHAFLPEVDGTIDIFIHTRKKGQFNIVVADNGVGLDRSSTDAEKQSLGLRLVDTLTAQLDGTLTIETGNGTRFSIIVNLSEPATKGTTT